MTIIFIRLFQPFGYGFRRRDLARDFHLSVDHERRGDHAPIVGDLVDVGDFAHRGVGAGESPGFFGAFLQLGALGAAGTEDFIFLLMLIRLLVWGKRTVPLRGRSLQYPCPTKDFDTRDQWLGMLPGSGDKKSSARPANQ